MHRLALTLATVAVLAACGDRAPQPTAADTFWNSLSGICGLSYSGVITEAIAGDTAFADKLLVMHVRECSDTVIRIPFHVGDDRSRTWVVSRLKNGGLRLKHDHRHADGVEDSVSQYGGDAPLDRITPTSVEFPADAFTAKLIPAAATNVWTMSITPGGRFVYALRREGTDRRFRVEFDLGLQMETPPPPWGSQ